MIFFDIDDTLVDSEGAHLYAIKKLALNYGVNEDLIDTYLHQWPKITDHFLAQYFENKIGLMEQRSSRIKAFWALMNIRIESDFAEEMYQKYHFLFLESCLLFEDTLTCLTELKDHRLGIISNGVTDDQLFKLKNNKLLNYFSSIIISDEVGVAKPQKEIFNYAASKNNLLLSECIYIGNAYTLDYEGGLNAGMEAYWLDRSDALKTNPATFKTLMEFATHLKSNR